MAHWIVTQGQAKLAKTTQNMTFPQRTPNPNQKLFFQFEQEDLTNP